MRSLRTILTAVLTGITSLGGASRAFAQDGSADAMAVVKRLFDGMRAGDSAVVRSVFHPKARLLSSSVQNGKPILAIEASPDNFVRAVGAPHTQVYDERIWNEKVMVDGPLASIWVDYAFYLGDKFSHCGIDHFLLGRDDQGRWSIVELADTRRTVGCKPSP